MFSEMMVIINWTETTEKISEEFFNIVTFTFNASMYEISTVWFLDARNRNISILKAEA